MTIYPALYVLIVLSCKTLIDLIVKYTAIPASCSVRFICPGFPAFFKRSKQPGINASHLFQQILGYRLTL